MTTTPHTPHAPQQQRTATSSGNPWLTAMWVITGALVMFGLIAVGANSDPMAFDYHHGWATIGAVMLGAAPITAGLTLAASAINWQQRQR